MNIVVLIARYLLAVAFIVFGLNGFLHFLPSSAPASDLAKQFVTALAVSHYMVVVFALQLIAGVLFLFRPTVPLALVLIAPVIVNILLFHITMDPAGIGPGAVVTILWFLVFWKFRRAFDGILSFADKSSK